MIPTLNGRADLHIHTTCSDGSASPEATLDYIAEHRQLDVIAITDHDTLEGSLWAYHHRHRYPFDIVPGVEVTSADGHVLALWVTRPIPKHLPLAETVAAIHAQNGIAILAHPFELFIAPRTFLRYLLNPKGLIESGIDAVEVHNAGAFTPFGNWLARRMYGRSPLPGVGGSDSHLPTTIGTGVTRFHGTDARALRNSLALGHVAAEGSRWGLTVYLKIYRTSRRNRQSAYLETNVSSTRLIRQ